MTPDRVKEELQWLRAVFQILAAVDVGLVAYIAQGEASRVMLGWAGVLLTGTTVVTLAVIWTVYRCLKQLE